MPNGEERRVLLGIRGYASLVGYCWVRPTALVGYVGSMGYMRSVDYTKKFPFNPPNTYNPYNPFNLRPIRPLRPLRRLGRSLAAFIFSSRCNRDHSTTPPLPSLAAYFVILSGAKRSRNISVLLGIIWARFAFWVLWVRPAAFMGSTGYVSYMGYVSYTKNPHLTHVTHPPQTTHPKTKNRQGLTKK